LTATTAAARNSGLRRLAAFIAQGMSYATTLSAVAYVMRPQVERDWGIAIAIALAVEILFAMMKETLFGNIGHPAGWVGLLLDGLTNTGGILPWAGRLLTFGPIALILGVFRVDVSDPTTRMIGGAILSIIFGFILSIVPHWLWRPARSRAK
jgi:hypothetical protein